VALDPCYIDTLRALLQLTEEYNGAEIGRIMRVPETAMNNRLRKLESLGLATSRQDGRQLLWKGVKR
jgi:DNA-binding transcriptional ArsR family regulator